MSLLDNPVQSQTDSDNEGPPAKASKLTYSINTVESIEILEKENSIPPADGSNSNLSSSGASSTMDAMEVDGVGNNGAAVANGNGATDGAGYDQQLYSRQIYTLGEAGMSRLRQARVLIAGMGGVGIEIAKNLILGGVRHVTIQDTKPSTWLDLSAQFYLTESDIGKNRAAASIDRLSELNDSVTVDCLTVSLSEDIVEKFHVVILTDSPFNEQIQVNEWTRKLGKKFIVAFSRGLFAQIFCDFGPTFQVDDVDGEQAIEIHVEHVDRFTGDVTTQEKAMHGLQDGDHVTFLDIKGMIELNRCEPRKITVKNPFTFNIGDISNFVDFTPDGGGLAKQVKMPKIFNFKSMVESVKDPEILLSDFAKFDRPISLHVAFMALHEFEAVHKRSPVPRCEEDAAKLLELCTKINRTLAQPTESLDRDVITELSFQAQGNLIPITGFIGGIAAQEAMKAVTGIFSPLNQWLYFDALECLPGAKNSVSPFKLTKELCQPKNCRYDGQLVVFGSDIQNALADQRWFIVGSGAIGCELLKYFSLMGLSCGDKGKLKITDMDMIEISNLNRQFLFRRPDIGSKKAEVAARAAKQFNPRLMVEALQERVGPDTENIFSDTFFEDLHGVANALDNVDARTYMDRRCVYYRLPLLESGTLGTKGNTQVVYPHLTESYSSSQDPPEKSIPICTLKNFPYKIEHTIQWARDLFEGLFSTPAEMANQFISDPRLFEERLGKLHTGQKQDLLEGIKKALIDDKPSNFEECVRWARLLFDDNFHNTVAQLLFNFPADQVTSQGAKFWSGIKRCPHVLQFSTKIPEHLDFVWAAANLRAEMYGIKGINDKMAVAELADAVDVPKFVPKSGVRIAVSDQEAQQMSDQSGDGDEENVQKIQIALAKLGAIKPLTAIDFEKDDDSNKHMDFITTCSNMRAENYSIEKASKLETKKIAGRIIPAIATTTAAVAGLIALELYKVVIGSGNCTLEQFKNGFKNLALPFFAFSEPIAASKKKYFDTEWTLWDCIEVQGDLTLQQLMDHMKTKYNLNISMLSQGVSMLYSFFMPPAKQQERKRKTIKQLVETITNKPIPEYVKALVLEAMCEDDQGEDVEIPYIKYILPSK